MNPELPGTYVNLLIETIKHWNVSPQQLLIDTDITLKELDAPFCYVDLNIFNNLLEKSARLTNEPAISVYLAKEMNESILLWSCGCNCCCIGKLGGGNRHS